MSINNKFQKTYANFLSKFLNPQRAIKIVIDCSNGSSGPIIKGIMNHESGIKNSIIHNSKFIILNSVPDGNFPNHSPNPLEKNATNQLSKEVIKNKADLGIIFDGDADRACFVDNKGRFINTDIIASLLIWHLKPKKNILDSTIGYAATEILSSLKLPYSTSRVGDYFILQEMRKQKADFGCEYSGHYYFEIPRNLFPERNRVESKDFYFNSGILAAIHIINAVSKLPYKISDFVDLTPKYYREDFSISPFRKGVRQLAEGDFDFNSLIPKVESHFSHNSLFKIQNSIKIDGIKINFPDSWLSIRPSNTEPLLRISIEAKNKQQLEKIKKKLLELING